MLEGKSDSSKVEEGKSKEKNPEVSTLPPLINAANRLDRLLWGPGAETNRAYYAYTNPAKVMKRWLGTSSGEASKASVALIAAAAKELLDPKGKAVEGKTLLMKEGDLMDTEEDKETPDARKYLSKFSEREVESWLLSLLVRLYWKSKKFDRAFEIAQTTLAILSKHMDSVATNVATTSGPGMASLFPLLARIYRYRSLVAESFTGNHPLTASLRNDLIKAQSIASLRRDVDSQATLLNLILKDLLNASQVEQAHKLLTNSTFPETASNNQLCRYLYNSGRIQALRLEYTSAFSNLGQCLRKTPSTVGLGFRITVQRLSIIVQLLMGEIPDRHIFFTPGMKKELAPYMAITQAVRRGDLSIFHQVVFNHSDRLREDKTYTLISRLAHQVIKAGLRKLHLSYSRISLDDVANRLGLPSAASAQFVVAKAVRDGVLEATIYHEEGYVQSHDLIDVYATQEPAEAFHRRIAYCLTTHNDAVRGMRYPPDAYKKQLEASRGNRRKAGDEKTDEEKAQELEDELDEDY